MREYIMRFRQKFLIEKKITTSEAILIEYLVKFFSSGNAISKQINDRVCFWITYDKVLKDLPVLNVQKRQLQRIFASLEKKEIMQKYIDESQKVYATFISCLWEMFDKTPTVKDESSDDEIDIPSKKNMSKYSNFDIPDAMGVCQKCPLIVSYNKNKINIFFYNPNQKAINGNEFCFKFLEKIREEISEVLFYECFNNTDVQKLSKNQISIWVDNVEWIYKQKLLADRVKKVAKLVIDDMLA